MYSGSENENVYGWSVDAVTWNPGESAASVDAPSRSQRVTR